MKKRAIYTKKTKSFLSKQYSKLAADYKHLAKYLKKF
jgi:hypothetical protein